MMSGQSGPFGVSSIEEETGLMAASIAVRDERSDLRLPPFSYAEIDSIIAGCVGDWFRYG
jgi:hypothetical protein